MGRVQLFLLVHVSLAVYPLPPPCLFGASLDRGVRVNDGDGDHVAGDEGL